MSPLEFQRGEDTLGVALESLGGDRYRVHVGEQAHEVQATALPDGRVRFVLGDQTFTAAAVTLRNPSGLPSRQVRVDGQSYVLAPAARGGGAAGGAGTGIVAAPMTGTLLEVRVAVGDSVSVGDTLAVVTAMKMEHKLVADVDGTVAEVSADVGATVDQGALVVRIDKVEV